MKSNAREILKASPVSYVRDAELRGRLFDNEDRSGVMSSVDTGFFVDHEEPLEALDRVREEKDWRFGELLEGHEFLFVGPAGSRHRRIPGMQLS
jgi:hypothetical protein